MPLLSAPTSVLRPWSLFLEFVPCFRGLPDRSDGGPVWLVSRAATPAGPPRRPWLSLITRAMHAKGDHAASPGPFRREPRPSRQLSAAPTRRRRRPEARPPGAWSVACRGATSQQAGGLRSRDSRGWAVGGVARRARRGVRGESDGEVRCPAGGRRALPRGAGGGPIDSAARRNYTCRTLRPDPGNPHRAAGREVPPWRPA
jgi:hypothetical protein